MARNKLIQAKGRQWERFPNMKNTASLATARERKGW